MDGAEGGVSAMEDYDYPYYENMREDLRLAERVERALDEILDEFGLDVWLTVDMHTRDADGRVETKRLVGEPERVERCAFCGRLTRYEHEEFGWVCAACLGEIRAKSRYSDNMLHGR